ncbi:MAG TPA: PEP-CTERM sorting domain-containing protein [Edaphobacter sp.]|nr:PEP-CTERM sorting domain-containing protein [Edaphobacter sp.]
MHSLPTACKLRISLVKAALLTAVAAALTVFAPAALHASPLTYNLTLTPSPGSTIGGTGTFTIDGAPAATGNTTYSLALGNLNDLSFTLAGQTFTLAGDTDAFIVFQNGSLYDITFAQELGTGTNDRYALHTTANYAFYYDNELNASYGTFTASQAPSASPVPEPASLLLLTTGLFGGAGMLYRRMAPQRAS